MALAGLAALPVSAYAQLGSFNPNPGPQGTFAIRGGTVVTVSGADIPNGTVVISGGKITAVGGATVQVPANAQDQRDWADGLRDDRDRVGHRSL
jgi:hypothetical protein